MMPSNSYSDFILLLYHLIRSYRQTRLITGPANLYTLKHWSHEHKLTLIRTEQSFSHHPTTFSVFRKLLIMVLLSIDLLLTW